MSLDRKETQCQYMAQQISFLRQAQSDWTSGLANYTNKIIHEIETWIHNSTPSTTFVEIAQLAQRAVIFITDKQATLSNNEQPNSLRNADDKNFVNLQSRVERLEELVSSLKTTIKTGTVRRENENSDSENQAKQNNDLKAMELLITKTDQKLSSKTQNLEDTLHRQNTQLVSQLERLESDFSQYKCKEIKAGQDNWTKLAGLETKCTLLTQLMLKRVTSLEHLRNCLNLKLGRIDDNQNQAKFDQLKTDIDTVSKSVLELKSAHDALSTKIAETWPPHPHMAPPFMPPPPPHPFHHGHHHRRHHHRQC